MAIWKTNPQGAYLNLLLCMDGNSLWGANSTYFEQMQVNEKIRYASNCTRQLRSPRRLKISQAFWDANTLELGQ